MTRVDECKGYSNVKFYGKFNAVNESDGKFYYCSTIIKIFWGYIQLKSYEAYDIA